MTEEPIDYRKEAFNKGLKMLLAEGYTDRRARSLIGKWRQMTGNDDEALCELLDKAEAVKPAVMAEWMGAAVFENCKRIRVKDGVYYIPRDSKPGQEWQAFFLRIHDRRAYDKGVLKVKTLWPR